MQCVLKESVKQFGCHDFPITYSAEYSYQMHYYLMPILQEDDKEDVELRTVDHLCSNLAFTSHIMYVLVLVVQFGSEEIILESVCCKKRPKMVPDQLLVWKIRAL